MKKQPAMALDTVSVKTTIPEVAIKVTDAERERAVFLCAMRDYCNAKLHATPEGQAVIAAANAMSAFTNEMSAKYGVAAPFDITQEGELVRSPNG